MHEGSGMQVSHLIGTENSGGAEHQEGVGMIYFGELFRCTGGMKALQPTDLVVFCSSEEKRAWKQRHEGTGSERSTALLLHAHPEGESPGV